MRILALVFLATVAIAQRPSHKKIVVENGAICENKASAFFVLDNTQLTAGDNVIYKEFSEDECLKTCSSNRDPFGRSILCASFVYDHVSFTCTIFKEKSRPEGKGEPTTSVGKRYFEKFCLNEDLPIECADAQFIRADDSVLVGFASKVELADTLEQCVATCVKDPTCKSSMYFYEEGECITNSENALTKPTAFTKEETEKVIYFQNGCMNKKGADSKEAEQKTPKLEETTVGESENTAADGTEYEENDEGSGEDEGEDEEQEGEGNGEVTEDGENGDTTDTDTSTQSTSQEDSTEHNTSDAASAEISPEVSVEKSAEHRGSDVPLEAEDSKPQTDSNEAPKTSSEVVADKSTIDDTSSEQAPQTEGHSEVFESSTSVENSTVDTDTTEKLAPSLDELDSNEQPDESEEATSPATTPEASEETASAEAVASTTPVEQEEGDEAVEGDAESDDSEEAEEEDEPTTTRSPRRKVGEKAQYLKYNKHPRNFGSKTLKTYKDKETKKAKKVKAETETEDDEEFQPVTVAAASQQQEQSDEPSEEDLRKEEEEFLGGEELPQGSEGTVRKHNIAIKPLKLKEHQLVAQNFFSEWSDWTPCTKSGERKIRRRKCLDLRRCLGALMQVENCAAVTTTVAPALPDDYDLPSFESVRSIVAEPKDVDEFAEQGARPVSLPSVLPGSGSSSSSASTEVDAQDWSPWLGVCQQFASGQPCNNGEMIGFESRECIAKNPAECHGPFFRYCTLQC